LPERVKRIFWLIVLCGGCDCNSVGPVLMDAGPTDAVMEASGDSPSFDTGVPERPCGEPIQRLTVDVPSGGMGGASARCGAGSTIAVGRVVGGTSALLVRTGTFGVGTTIDEVTELSAEREWEVIGLGCQDESLALLEARDGSEWLWASLEPPGRLVTQPIPAGVTGDPLSAWAAVADAFVSVRSTSDGGYASLRVSSTGVEVTPFTPPAADATYSIASDHDRAVAVAVGGAAAWVALVGADGSFGDWVPTFDSPNVSAVASRDGVALTSWTDGGEVEVSLRDWRLEEVEHRRLTARPGLMHAAFLRGDPDGLITTEWVSSSQRVLRYSGIEGTEVISTRVLTSEVATSQLYWETEDGGHAVAMAGSHFFVDAFALCGGGE
jgi:hypothetical protein